MAKEFKDWNKPFSAEEIAKCRTRWLDKATNVTGWMFGYQQPSQDRVQYAVYQAPDVRDWQLFRVSLKGLTTTKKLVMLTRRFMELGHLSREVIRTMNYIGALRRGGQLNAGLQIVKCAQPQSLEKGTTMSKQNLSKIRQKSGVSENAVFKVLAAMEGMTMSDMEGTVAVAAGLLEDQTKSPAEAVGGASKGLTKGDLPPAGKSAAKPSTKSTKPSDDGEDNKDT